MPPPNPAGEPSHSAPALRIPGCCSPGDQVNGGLLVGEGWRVNGWLVDGEWLVNGWFMDGYLEGEWLVDG